MSGFPTWVGFTGLVVVLLVALSVALLLGGTALSRTTRSIEGALSETQAEGSTHLLIRWRLGPAHRVPWRRLGTPVRKPVNSRA